MEQKWESRSKPFNFEWVNFNKSAETIQGGKNTPIFSTNSVEITGCPHAKDWNWAPSSHHTWKLTQMNHRGKCESTSIKLLEKKMGVNLCKFTSLIIHKIKSTSDKIKMHKSHCIKIKSAFFFFLLQMIHQESENTTHFQIIYWINHLYPGQSENSYSTRLKNKYFN